jgi:hypothetical protein
MRNWTYVEITRWPILSRVYIGKGYAIMPATATLTTYLPWPPWGS